MIDLGSYLQLVIFGERERRFPRKPRRGPARDAKYRAWIRTLPSVVSGQGPCEAAHTGTDGGMSQKASDYSCVPLTMPEHREYHQIGKREFEKRHGIRFVAAVRELNQQYFSARHAVDGMPVVALAAYATKRIR
jgi:hypothetical protein